jgi:hypothetical protein
MNMGGRGKEAAFVSKIQANLHRGAKSHLGGLRESLREGREHITALQFLMAGATRVDFVEYASCARRRSESIREDASLWQSDYYKAEQLLRGEKPRDVFKVELRKSEAAGSKGFTVTGI